MRGSLKLFNDFFAPATTGPSQLELVKGRSAELNAARNEKLLHRYYWHGRREIEPGKKMCYQSLLNTLSQEFDLSTRTISNVLDDNYRQLHDIKTRFAVLTVREISRELQKKYPYLIW